MSPPAARSLPGLWADRSPHNVHLFMSPRNVHQQKEEARQHLPGGLGKIGRPADKSTRGKAKPGKTSSPSRASWGPRVYMGVSGVQTSTVWLVGQIFQTRRVPAASQRSARSATSFLLWLALTTSATRSGAGA